MSSFAELELNVVRWSEDRKIIPNSTPTAQLVKLFEEVEELKVAIDTENRQEAVDAIGDCTVVLINICALMDVNLTDCLGHAYSQIKNRRGTLGEDGIFYKENSV